MLVMTVMSVGDSALRFDPTSKFDQRPLSRYVSSMLFKPINLKNKNRTLSARRFGSTLYHLTLNDRHLNAVAPAETKTEIVIKLIVKATRFITHNPLRLFLSQILPFMGNQVNMPLR